jgi:hypothetical protein
MPMRPRNPQVNKEVTNQKDIAAGELQQLFPSFTLAF